MYEATIYIPFDFELHQLIESALNTSKAISALHATLAKTQKEKTALTKIPGIHLIVSRLRVEFLDSDFESRLERNYLLSLQEQVWASADLFCLSFVRLIVVHIKQQRMLREEAFLEKIKEKGVLPTFFHTLPFADPAILDLLKPAIPELSHLTTEKLFQMFTALQVCSLCLDVVVGDIQTNLLR